MLSEASNTAFNEVHKTPLKVNVGLEEESYEYSEICSLPISSLFTFIGVPKAPLYCFQI